MHTEAKEYRLDLVADLNRWQAFLVIGELGSITRAAILLDTNASLISRQLNQLERDCGMRLFERTGRGMKLSEAGRRLFGQVQALLGHAEMLERSIRDDAAEIADAVTVGLVPSLVMPLMPHLYDTLRRLHPGIQLKVVEGTAGWIEEWLASNRIDIGLLYRPGVPPVIEQGLAVVDSYLIGPAGDKLTSGEDVPFSALSGLSLIMPGSPNAFRGGLERLSREYGQKLQFATESDSLQLAKSLVAAGHGYTVLPIHAVWSEVNEGRLQASKIAEPDFSLTITMAQATAKAVPRAVTAVASQIVSIIHAMAPDGLWTSMTNKPAIT